MFRREIPIRLALLASAVLLVPAAASAQTRLLPFGRRVEADPQKHYVLTEQDGPWMIMAASFAGADGERMAHELVIELRRELRVPAWIYHMRVDYEDQVEGLGLQLNPNDPGLQPVRPRMRHLNLQDFEETAVLVGAFDSVEDPKAQKLLEKVKAFEPRMLSTMSPDQMAAFRQHQLRSHFRGLDDQGPLHNAFICPNPMLPKEFLAQQGPDRFVYDLNKDFEFSLMRNPKRYSLKVATFRGESSFDLGEIEEKKKEFSLRALLGQGIETKFAEAEDKAHRLTLALRQRGIEAYEFHDRTRSYVCVGSFDELFVRDANGIETPHPDVTYWVQQFQPQPIRGPLRDSQNRSVVGALEPFRLPELQDIPFDYSPEPVEVPRFSIGSEYATGNRR